MKRIERSVLAARRAALRNYEMVGEHCFNRVLGRFVEGTAESNARHDAFVGLVVWRGFDHQEVARAFCTLGLQNRKV